MENYTHRLPLLFKVYEIDPYVVENSACPGQRKYKIGLRQAGSKEKSLRKRKISNLRHMPSYSNKLGH